METATDLLREAAWEMEGVRRAASRYWETAQKTDLANLPSGQWLMRQIIPSLTEGIAGRQGEALAGFGAAGAKPDWAWVIQTLPAQALAFITLVRALSVVREPDLSIASLSTGIAKSVADEVGYQEWVKEQKAEAKEAKLDGIWDRPDLLAQLRRTYPDVNNRTWGKWRARQGIPPTKWPLRERLALGTVLIEALLHAAPAHFTLGMATEEGRTERRLVLSPATLAIINDIEARAEIAHPQETVMLIPPRKWEFVNQRTPSDKTDDTTLKPRLQGGYVIHALDAFGSGRAQHTRALPENVSDTDLRSWNALQETPYRVNTWVLDVMQEAYRSRLVLGGLEIGEPRALPPRAPEGVWEGMSPEAKTEVRNARRLIRQDNASIMGQSQSILDILMMSEELREVERFWYPVTRDFRHRLYMRGTRGPHPQGSDIAKALVMFAEGKALGPDGFWWLAIRAANTFGQDKLSLEERFKWTMDNLTRLQASARDPLQYLWWTEASEPWNFLASCHEMEMATGGSLSPSAETTTAFVSHLPIPMDGSCNGLQHLSAMGLDPVGALATNLTSCSIRQDIYSEVAAKVAAAVLRDANAGVPGAAEWVGKVTRNTVKRAVMTTPYGVTQRGIRDQLVNDKAIPPGEEGVNVKAAYMTTKIMEALDGTVQSASAIMAWLRDTAAKLGKGNVPFDWTTPSGSRVRQAYLETTVERINTLLGKLSLQSENAEGSLQWRKQAAGSAPNVIHSFDAAHLSLTVNAALDAGITDFTMIHDSYATHAGATTVLSVLLRRAFVSIYSRDWLESIAAEVRSYAPWIDLAPLPERGDFDINQVNDAEYFFS